MAHRCSICDRTDDKRLLIDPEHYFKGPYHFNKQKECICDECETIIRETLYEFEELNEDKEDDPGYNVA